jgi:hypothetical protein
MTSPEVDITKTFMNVPVFQWKGDTVERFHELNFPVLFYSDPDWKPYLPPGLKAIASFFSEGGLTSLESATLLLGNCHMEYPLGIVIESPLVMRYANASIEVKPYAEVDFDELGNDPPDGFDMDQFEEDIENDNLDDYTDLFGDNLDGDSGAVDELSEVYINYENREMPYGMLDYPAYDSLSEYKPDVPANFPPNCYSLIQYAKKATYFYDSFGQFLSQHSRHPDDNTAYYLNGVVYIKDGIEVETDNPLRLKGKGILVCKKDIKLHADVVRVGEDSVVSLISRGGAIYFEDGCKSVQAACFSNLAPVTTTSNIVRIYGNLVTNEFNRDQITELEIFYDSKSCRTSPLSVIRDVGKFAPSRYWVSMPDNWASFKYEKFEEN